MLPVNWRRHLILTTMVAATSASSCKQNPASGLANAKADLGNCKTNDEAAKLLGNVFGALISNAGGFVPGGSIVQGIVKAGGSAGSSALPALLGDCDVKALTLQVFKKDVDERLGTLTKELNKLSTAQIESSLVFYSDQWDKAVARIEDARFNALATPDKVDLRDTHFNSLASAYSDMSITLDTMTAKAKTETSVAFMAAVTDLAMANGYFALKDGDGLLTAMLSPGAVVNDGTKRLFIHNYDAMAESYVHFLNTVADRKNAANLPSLQITKLSGFKLTGPQAVIDGHVTRACPYAVPVQKQPLVLKFSDDKTTTLQYQYLAFGGSTGFGDITGEKLNNTEITLMSRPNDLKSRTGSTTFLGDVCDLAALVRDETKLGDYVGAAIEVDPAAATNPELAKLNKAVEDAKNTFQAIDSEKLKYVSDWVNAYLAWDTRLSYHYDAASATGVPSLEDVVITGAASAPGSNDAGSGGGANATSDGNGSGT